MVDDVDDVSLPVAQAQRRRLLPVVAEPVNLGQLRHDGVRVTRTGGLAPGVDQEGECSPCFDQLKLRRVADQPYLRAGIGREARDGVEGLGGRSATTHRS